MHDPMEKAVVQWIDLSHVLDDQTPVYPGDPPVRCTILSRVEEDGFQLTEFRLSSHSSTHIDAPSHFIRNGKQLDEIPIDQFVGRAIVVDIDDGAAAYDQAHRSLKMGHCDVILIRSGWDRWYGDEKYFQEHPTLDPERLKPLLEYPLKWIGVDMPSPDHPPYPVHTLLLSREILIVENLRGLDRLQLGVCYEIYALPIKAHADGAPARVICKSVTT